MMRILHYCMVMAAALGWASAAQAEVVKTEQNAFVTRDSAVVKATPRETWLKLISPAEWWNASHTFSGDTANMMLTPQAGGCFCETIPADDTARKVGLAGSVEHMNVLLSIPDTALRMRGSLGPLQSEPATGILTVTLAEVDGGTKITFEYVVAGYMRFEVPVIAKAVDAVMSEQLSGLSKQLGPITPIDEASKEANKPAGAEQKAPPSTGKPADKPAAAKAADDAKNESPAKDGAAKDGSKTE